MDKRIEIEPKFVPHIRWDKLIMEMVDVWRAVKVTKSDDGTVVVEVVEEEGK